MYRYTCTCIHTLEYIYIYMCSFNGVWSCTSRPTCTSTCCLFFVWAHVRSREVTWCFSTVFNIFCPHAIISLLESNSVFYGYYTDVCSFIKLYDVVALWQRVLTQALLTLTMCVYKLLCQHFLSHDCQAMWDEWKYLVYFCSAGWNRTCTATGGKPNVYLQCSRVHLSVVVVLTHCRRCGHCKIN